MTYSVMSSVQVLKHFFVGSDIISNTSTSDVLFILINIFDIFNMQFSRNNVESVLPFRLVLKILSYLRTCQLLS